MTNTKDDPKAVDTQLYTKAAAALKKEVEDDLKKKDPDSPEEGAKAIAGATRS